MDKMKVLKYAETKLDKEETRNGTCIGIGLDELTDDNFKEKIDDLLDKCCYRFNSSSIHRDNYGIERLIFFSV